MMVTTSFCIAVFILFCGFMSLSWLIVSAICRSFTPFIFAALLTPSLFNLMFNVIEHADSINKLFG